MSTRSAALSDMSDVFRLREADVFRVTAIEQNPPHPSGLLPTDTSPDRISSPELAGLSELAGYIARAADLDVSVDTVLEGLERLLGYRHTLLLLLDEGGTRLYTIASRGFDTQSLGAEVEIGRGQIGLAAARCEPLRIGGLRGMEKYAESVRRQLDDLMGPGHDVPLPGVVGVQSRIVVPAMARGELVGVLVAESRRPVAFGAVDEQVLSVVGSMLASAVEHVRTVELDDADVGPVKGPAATTPGLEVAASDGVPFRFFAVDGSVFVDGDDLIKGVAGRILWSLLNQYAADGRGEFTNRELRLDPALDLPGFKDNLESRLILLKRRLDEREVPVRIEKTGRGRFRLVVSVVPTRVRRSLRDSGRDLRRHRRHLPRAARRTDRRTGRGTDAGALPPLMRWSRSPRRAGGLGRPVRV